MFFQLTIFYIQLYENSQAYWILGYDVFRIQFSHYQVVNCSDVISNSLFILTAMKAFKLLMQIQCDPNGVLKQKCYQLLVAWKIRCSLCILYIFCGFDRQ